MTEQKIRKGMIVAREESLIIAKALGQVLKIVNVAVDVCDHGSALNTFLETEPEICIVMDYSERAESAGFPGKKTFKMLKATAESHRSSSKSDLRPALIGLSATALHGGKTLPVDRMITPWSFWEVLINKNFYLVNLSGRKFHYETSRPLFFTLY